MITSLELFHRTNTNEWINERTDARTEEQQQNVDIIVAHVDIDIRKIRNFRNIYRLYSFQRGALISMTLIYIGSDPLITSDFKQVCKSLSFVSLVGSITSCFQCFDVRIIVIITMDLMILKEYPSA